MMNRKFLIIGLLSIVLLACNNTSNDSSSENGEKELLEKEVELLKKEKELPEKENKSEQQDTVANSISKTTSTEKQNVDKNTLITDNAVGIFRIGKSIPFPSSSDTYKITKEIQTRMTEEGPYEETVYIVLKKGEELLNLKLAYDHNTETYTDKIGEIVILSDIYKTKEGIGVNSTIEEFIKKYPRFNLWYTYVSGMYVIDSDGTETQFILNEKDFIGDLNITSERTELKRSDFKKSATIMKIRVY